MTDQTRAQLRAIVAQVGALKEQATALGMQVATLEQALQAVFASEPLPPLSATPSRTGPGPAKYYGPGPLAPVLPAPAPSPEGASTK